MTTQCTFCGRDIDPNSRYTYRRIQGWHRPGKAGGSDITLREPMGIFACPGCITLRKSERRDHVTPGQQTLI